MCYKVADGAGALRRWRARAAAARALVARGDPPAGQAGGVWALPKGLIDAGESAAATAVREVAEETGLDGRLEGKLGDVRYVYTRRGGERVFKVVSFFLLRYRARPDRRAPAGDGASRWRRRAGSRSTRRRGSSPTAASATWPKRRSRSSPSALYDGAAVAMFALNFYSPLVADQLRTHRKTATIRLGDKSGKYKKGMIVTVLVGVRYGQREKIFDAVIDKVEVKQIRDLSPREIEHDNPEIRRPDEMTRFLGQLYNRDVSEDEMVTVIRFSQIIGSMF